MPLYEFKCDECGTVIEFISTGASPAGFEPLCPDCGEPLRKVPSAPAFVVTGYNAKNGYAK